MNAIGGGEVMKNWVWQRGSGGYSPSFSQL